MSRYATVRASRASASPGIVATIALLSFVLGGCPTEPDKDPLTVQDPPGYKEPGPLIAAHALALSKQDYAKYEKFLHENFEYHPRSEDLIDFPWLQGESWNRTDELQMIANMFDDNFHPVSDSTGTTPAGTVATIEAKLTVTGTRSEPDGSLIVDAGAVMTVLYVDGNGARCDIRFEFHLVTGTDGYLRVRSIEERPPYLRTVESETWARIKSLYRQQVTP